MSATSNDLAAARHAFAETVDLEGYVPRLAMESLLASIDEWRSQDCVGSTLAALVTEPGIGKTFFLRLVEQRINEDAAAAGKSPPRALYLPYAGLNVTDLAIWVYGLLGLSWRQPDAEDQTGPAMAALLALGERTLDPFFLLIDDADSAPEETIRVLQEGLPRECSPLRILATLSDDERSSRFLDGLDGLEPAVAIVRKAMSEDETAEYLRTRVRQARLSEEAVGGLGAQQISRLHALSGGVPREIHRIMMRVLDARERGLPSPLDAHET